ncbi:melanoma inhibitory activity protein 2-like isoform X2 [Denticeps clupeoides]|uniref:melanoma inhibitory activity protein 2-like isoform X2 n=1 Tax=Denticeps clupeoides TaxID=299321 RepID=UPI0010A3C0AD|nr:melanoma inhibitory activity protein 2-like isoform X2 [Denticeps clupeoides]
MLFADMVEEVNMDTEATGVSMYYSLALEKVVSTLPDDIRPGPDLYGLPWEAVIFTVLLSFCILLGFSCRFYQSVKSRLYASRERKMGQKVAELLEEKCKVLETLSECKHKYEKLDAALQNGGILAHLEEKENLEAMSCQLQESNSHMEADIEGLKEDLSIQQETRVQQDEMLAEMQETLKRLEEDSKGLKSQMEQAKTTLKIYDMNSERLQKSLLAAKEENALLHESKAQLAQEAEGWGERLCELEEEMKMCETAHRSMIEDCATKDERIKSLTDCLLKMKDWDSELGDEANADDSGRTENGETSEFHEQQKVQELICAAKLSADLKSIEEDKSRLVARLADEVKAKEDLQEGIEQLQRQKEQLQSQSSMFSIESQKLQQKLTIMTEMYQENELKLHRMLTVEERERLQKEEKLNKADKMITLAAEELSTYRQRAQELEDEQEKTNQAYKNQIASREKKAHDNWLAARTAERDLADIKRENAHLRQKLTDAQFKLEVVEKDPYALDPIGRPLFRGERSPFGPSPLSRPSSETRAFLSPPTLMDGPPPRLSPQFPLGPGGRASQGLVEPPGGGGDFERSGGPHSDSGSISPTWERDRRPVPIPPPGHPYPEPPFRRPPPVAFPMGTLPTRPPLPPESHSYGLYSSEKQNSFLSNSSGTGEGESGGSMISGPGDLRIPPDAPVDPRDTHFQRRGPYGPTDFYPHRGHIGPPLGMRGPLPPGMFPRFPPHMGYPPVRAPPDSFPPGPPPRPSPPGSEQPPDQSPSPQGVI